MDRLKNLEKHHERMQQILSQKPSRRSSTRLSSFRTLHETTVKNAVIRDPIIKQIRKESKQFITFDQFARVKV